MSQRSERYNPHAIEGKWQTHWDAQQLYRFTEHPSKPKHYALTMFPYPSGNLHIGHWYAYIGPDARARFMRMCGHNVFFPMGFDAFGLPAENAALQRGLNPKKWTYENISTMTEQFRRMGSMLDWSSQMATCDPNYYRWNQWFFLQMLERGLAYKKESFVNWDPVEQSVLANEQVVDGRGERSGALVERRLMNQWHFKITAYAEELLDFGDTQMPERVRLMQQHWIGKSVGAEVDFSSPAGNLTVFTTRPDTLLGATFLVIAPEHPLVEALTTPENRDAVQAYVAQAAKTSEIDRQAEGREKTGIFSGSYATHPISQQTVPIWIADYVLVTYGTGAIMAVPAHDQRDFEFARTFGLPIVEVIRGETPMQLDATLPDLATTAYSGEGIIVNSGILDGLQGGKTHIAQVIERLSSYGVQAKTTYRLRDWLISRQRYWGTPIPIIYCDSCGMQAVPDEQLPLVLPDDEGVVFAGRNPLEVHPTWKHTTCPSCQGPAVRDTDTMDTFVDSSWYMYRFLSPDSQTTPFESSKDDFMPIDLYTGGIEHAILHLLYSRFWTKVMRDLGLTSHSEPFKKLLNQGMILGEDHEKMSKSRGNVLDPDNLVREYGADTVRIYLMFLAPWEDGAPWSSTGITGPHKWLNRIWSLYFDGADGGPNENLSEADVRFASHTALKRVTNDLERLSFNTAIPAMMELTNTLVKAKRSSVFGSAAWQEALHLLNLMLAPFAPHLAEELWLHTHNQGQEQGESVHLQAWPAFDESALVKSTIEIAVQVNGKLRASILVEASNSKEDIIALAKQHDNVARHLESGNIVKEIYVPGRLVNIVVK